MLRHPVVLCLMILPVSLGSLWTDVRGHDDLGHAIATLTRRLESRLDPRDLLARGELYRLDASFPEALRDYDRAATLGADPGTVARCRAGLYLDTGRPRDALESLADLPEDPETLELRYRALVALERPREALVALDRSLALDPRPVADRYLQRTRWALAAGLDTPEGALQVLDEGIARLGPDPSLIRAAVDLELAGPDPERAATRLGIAAGSSDSPVPFLVRQGEVLLALDRPDEARESLLEARECLAKLPESRRRTALVTRLEERIDKALNHKELEE